MSWDVIELSMKVFNATIKGGFNWIINSHELYTELSMNTPIDDFEEEVPFQNNPFAGIPNNMTMPDSPPQPMAAMGSANPLSSYFRVPGASIGIPSQGHYYTRDVVDMEIGGLLEIYPMGAADEVLLKAPDALMTGIAVERAIASCVPQIRKPDMLLAPDVDFLLLAIRSVTYGKEMPMRDLFCPNCNHNESYMVDLKHVLSTMKTIPAEITLRINKDMVLTMAPQRTRQQTAISNMIFEIYREGQALDMTPDASEEDKNALEMSMYNKLRDSQYRSMANTIVSVSTPMGTITNYDHILEFVSKAHLDVQKMIETKATELNDSYVDNKFTTECEKCKHQWDNKISFDPSSFFGTSYSA